MSDADFHKEDEMEAYGLLGDKVKDQMDCTESNTEEWCLLAERYIRINRNINRLIWTRGETP